MKEEALVALLEHTVDKLLVHLGTERTCRERHSLTTLEDFLMERGLWEYQTIAREAKKTGGEWLFTKYRKSFVRGLQNAVETYARDVDQSDYYDGYDVNVDIVL